MTNNQTIKDNNVKIGDLITLKFLKNQSFLSSEGVMVEDVLVSQSLKFFEEHLFQIYVQRQYSATNELDELNLHNEITNQTLDQGSINHLEALVKGKENEIMLNKSVMKSKTGNVLCFGDTIQLLHVKSRKYVTVRPSDLARDERENMRVTLSTDGSVMSWIKIMPRYKINREGEPIKTNTEILLKVSERSNEYLHCADRPPPRGKAREVNSSLESPTPWRINVFQKVVEAQDRNLLLSGELVYIRDPESQCMLAPLARPMSIQVSTGGQNSTRLNSPESQFFESPWPSEKFNILSSTVDDDEVTEEVPDDVSIASIDEFILDYGGVALKPMEEDTLDSDAIWMLESKSIAKGGIVKFKTECVHLRHFNTGMYLSLRKPEGDDDKPFLLTLEADPSEDDLFSVIQLHSNSDFLHNAKAMQLKHEKTGFYIERGTYQDSQRVYTCSTTRTKSKGVNIIMNRYTQKEKFTASKALSKVGDEVLDIYFGQAIMFHFRKFVKGTVLPATNISEANTIWPKMDMVDRPLFFAILSHTALFVKGFPVGYQPDATSDMSKFKAEKYVITRRQNMLREQGLLQDLVTMLNTLKPIADWSVAMDQSTNKMHKAGVMETSLTVLSECLNLLYDMIRQNLVNQLYIADHLLVILAHVSTDRMAAKVAQELLSSNRELQETKIGLREITIFAEKMREAQMNAMYLQLLQTCCSCQGQGVPKNQEIVNSVVFHKYSDILINVVETYEKLAHADWTPISGTSSFQLYLQPYMQGGALRALTLYSNGVPTVSLNWSTRSSRYNPAKLFSRQPVLLTDMYRPMSQLMRSRENTTTTTVKGPMKDSDHRKTIADFFIAEMRLSAEMCLGRNYPVMRDMEHFFSYELLVTILQTSHSDGLKSAAASLLLSLYIDRDPQTEVQLPRLTRTITEIASNTNAVPLMCVEASRLPEFGLVQYIISQHLSSIKNKPFPSHTLNMMKVLHKLVSFNFYGQSDKLRETIDLLVDCLNRDQSDLDNTVDSNALLYMSMRKSVTPSRRNSMKKSSAASSRSLLSQGENDLDKLASFVSDLNTSSDLNEVPEIQKSYSFASIMSSVTSKSGAGKLLKWMESTTAHCAMMVFVAACVAVSLYDNFSSKHEGTPYYYFDWAVAVVFVVEFIVHLILHVVVRGELVSYVANIFHWVDLMAIGAYIVVMVVSPHTVLGRFIMCVGFRRVFILTKIFIDDRAAALRLQQSLKDSVKLWTEPDRYFKTADYTLTTIVKIVQILCSVQRNIEDLHLSQLLRRFHEWSKDPRYSADHVSDLLISVLNSTDLSTSNPAYDDLYIDLLMYSSAPLVQVTLELLMIHHSSIRILLENTTRLQMISSSEGESQYNKMEAVLKVLKRDADTHEIWGKLTLPEHRKISADMLYQLNALTEDCRKKREVLKFDETYEPVKVAQNILRNLGCFGLCLKITQLISSIDNNDPFNECHMNTRNLALASNRLLYWFILDNLANQSIAFSHLKYFIKIIDEKVESHKVIGAIFHNNIDLMESVPKKYISDFAELICSTGRFPQYLTLMSSIIAVGEKNVIANQYEVIKRLCSPENQKKVVLFFVPVTHPDYTNKKTKLMNHYLNIKDVSVDDLPSDLAYHLELLGLLSSCTISKSGMTTVEAKVQSMFHFVDIIEAMLDPNCLLLAKIRYGLFLYNAVIDVETPLPALKDADCMWRLIISTQDIFSFARDDLRYIEKNGWSSPGSCRQKIEYMLVCAMVIHGYFAQNYEHTIFKPEVGQVAIGVERMTLKEHQAQEIIKSLYMKVAAIYEMLSPLLAVEHHALLFHTLQVLNEKAKDKIVGFVEDIHSEYFRSAQDYTAVRGDGDGKSFEDFTLALITNSRVKDLAGNQVQGFIEKLESLPSVNDVSSSSVRFEPLIEKLVTHIRGTIQVIAHGDESVKFVERDATKTDIWMIKIMRTMIENKWGMSIYKRDDDGGEEQDNAVLGLMQVYNESGVTEMCLDMIAKGIDISLQSEALKLLVGMLFKEGGALDIQKTIHAHLSKSGSDMFFSNVRTILGNLMSWHKWTGVVELDEDAEPALPDEFILVRCLQLMCEGHFLPNQDIMREQPNNNVSINLLDTFVEYLQTLDNLICRTSTTAAMAVSATILEVIQGPCIGNQDYFALSTELIETLNRKMRQHPQRDCDETQEIELKKSAIDIFQGLLEGQGRRTAVYERMLSVIHIDVIHVLSTGSAESGEDKEESEEAEQLRTECLVLMQMLTDFRPALKKELAMNEEDDGIVNDSVACVEVVWRGELQRRFFHVPDICHALAKSTKDSFVMYVKRASPEDKLYGLLESSREMYREVLHQTQLKDYGLDKLFSRTNQHRTTWATFYIVLALNILFLIFYRTEDRDCSIPGTDDGSIVYSILVNDDPKCTNISFDSRVRTAVEVLNFILIGLAAFTLVLYLFVRVPVNYRTYMEAEMGVLQSIFLTAMDPVALYHAVYLAMAVIGVWYHAALTFLLLDFISMSPASQGVLKAVYNPRKQIFMTIVLTLIILYIFAMYEFFFFNSPANFVDAPNVITLVNTFKFLIRWGLPEGTAANQMEMTISTYRVFCDVGFFVATMLMLNILKGITIDTFVELRKQLEERVADTNEKCFICGIEKNTFNRTLDRDAFRQHIKVDQNMWNYIYFIIYIWEQDKDDDDGLESYVRRCVDESDLIWFPMNKAIRLAEHRDKGDVNSLKYRFRKDMQRTESTMHDKLHMFKDQLNRTIARVEKALEYEQEVDNTQKARRATARLGVSVSNGGFGIPSTPVATPNNGSRSRQLSRLLSSKSPGTDSPSRSRSTSENFVTSAAINGAFAASLDMAPRITRMDNRSSSAAPLVAFNAMDADNMCQMHMRVVSIAGLNIRREHLSQISVHVVSEFTQSVWRPMPEEQQDLTTFIKNVENAVNRAPSDVPASPKSKPRGIAKPSSSFINGPISLRDSFSSGLGGSDMDKNLLRFDMLANPSLLVHEGPLPKVDLSKIVVKVQVLFGKGDQTVFVAGVSIPFVSLIAKAEVGGVLETAFEQKAYEVEATPLGSGDMRVIDLSEEGESKILLAESPFCVITVSAIASHKLLKDWSAVNK